MEALTYAIEELPRISKLLASRLSDDIVCFYGPMGAGKTTLIKAIVKELGAVDFGNSPTFGLVNEYHDGNGHVLAYHFDFYRIDSLEEALDLGLEDYFDSGVRIFIEWPERIESLLPNDRHNVYLSMVDASTREIRP